MASYNKVLLMGNLTRDPELRSTQGGTAVCKFGMAVNRKYKDKEETTFVDLTAWGRVAEVVHEYCTKGSPLFVDGRLEYSTWQKDGETHSKLSVIAESVQLMGGKSDGARPAVRGGHPRHQEADSDSIPF